MLSRVKLHASATRADTKKKKKEKAKETETVDIKPGEQNTGERAKMTAGSLAPLCPLVLHSSCAYFND